MTNGNFKQNYSCKGLWTMTLDIYTHSKNAMIQENPANKPTAVEDWTTTTSLTDYGCYSQSYFCPSFIKQSVFDTIVTLSWWSQDVNVSLETQHRVVETKLCSWRNKSVLYADHQRLSHRRAAYIGQSMTKRVIDSFENWSDQSHDRRPLIGEGSIDPKEWVIGGGRWSMRREDRGYSCLLLCHACRNNHLRGQKAAIQMATMTARRTSANNSKMEVL